MVETLKPNGVFIHCTKRRDLLQLKEANLPTVNTSDVLGALPIPTVTLDNCQTGVLAAEYLIEQECQHFATFGKTHQIYGTSRVDSFVATLQARGASIEKYTQMLRQFTRPKLPIPRLFADWVSSLPPRTGVFCPDEEHVHRFAEVCRELSIDVLSRFSILSGHFRDTPSAVEASGIKQPEQEWAQQAATLLHQMLTERKDVEETTLLRLPPEGVEERETSLAPPRRDEFLQRALKSIRQSATDGITVHDVSLKAGLGRRALERRFRDNIGSSILEEIQRCQVEHAKDLLRNTNRTVYAIARESGLTNDNALRRIFAKWVKQSPVEYREMSRKEGP